MGYYDALIAKWATLQGDAATRLASVNGLTVAGPVVDVPARTVRAALYQRGSWLRIELTAQQTPSADPSLPGNVAIIAAHALVKMADQGDAFPMTQPGIAAVLGASLDALVGFKLADGKGVIFAAGERAPLDAGCKAAVLALAATSIPWATAPLELLGGGLASSVAPADLEMAGLA